MMSRFEFSCFDGRQLLVKVQRRKGARHLRLRLNVRNQIILSAPWHCPDQACRNFIDGNRSWLENQLNQAPQVVGIRDWFQQSSWLSVGGRQLAVKLLESASAASPANCRVDAALGRVDFCLPVGAGGAALSSLVRQLAGKAIKQRVAVLAQGIGLQPGRVSVRDQSSRWGSCSCRNNISLNWRLILLAPELQDYVIMHELAHLTELNHSRRFWQLLDHYDPERCQHEARLNAITPALMRVRL